MPSTKHTVFVPMERGDAAEFALNAYGPVTVTFDHNGVTLTGPYDDIVAILSDFCYAHQSELDYLINQIKEIPNV